MNKQINKRNKRETYPVYPKHSDSSPYLPQKLNKVIQIPVHLSWVTFSNDSDYSALRSLSNCLLMFRVNTVSAMAISRGPKQLQ